MTKELLLGCGVLALATAFQRPWQVPAAGAFPPSPPTHASTPDFGTAFAAGERLSAGLSDAARNRVARTLSMVPVRFQPNRGQTESGFDFLVRGSAYEVLLSSTATRLSLGRVAGTRVPHSMSLVGADPAARGQGEMRLSGKSHYFLGQDPAGWRVDIPSYGQVRYQSVYPGIDVVYGAEGPDLQYDFVVAPRADPAAIRLRFDGADRLALNEGDLVVETDGHEVHHRRPFIYQQIGGTQRKVAGRFSLHSDATVGFDIDPYDERLPLIIDPTVVFDLDLGSSPGRLEHNLVRDIALDAAGNLYATGRSTNYFGLPDSIPRPSDDAFVLKLDPFGNLVYEAIFGGTAGESGDGITIDATGNVYIAGPTLSRDFPVLNAVQPNAADTPDCEERKACGDAFVLKLNVSGRGLVFSTYLGGREFDDARAIDVDALGAVYITGMTRSPDLPVSNTLQSQPGGSIDGFITKLQPDGSSAYSSYLGGRRDDFPADLTVDAVGNAYVTGTTNSENFPFTSAPGSALEDDDAFVVKLNAGGSEIAYATRLGGTLRDVAHGVALGAEGSVYVTGRTLSADFPVLNAFQPSPSDPVFLDAFVTKLDSSGSLAYSTYLGGMSGDIGIDIAVDACGKAYVLGGTGSANFPTQLPLEGEGAPDPLFGGLFLSVFRADGSDLVFSSSLTRAQEATAIEVTGCAGAILLAVNKGMIRTPSVYSSLIKIDAGTDLDGDGIPDIVESDVGRNPERLDNVIFSRPRLFVMQQYRDILSREADPAGLEHWLSVLRSGGFGTEKMVDALLSSSEARSSEPPVIRLYFSFFGRIPDYPGLVFWTDQLERGVPLPRIAGAFASSAGFQSRYGGLDDRAFVASVYRNVLGRDPDPGGSAYWEGQLGRGLPRASVLLAFSESPEYRERSGAEVYIVHASAALLKRAPRQTVFDAWVGRLDMGTPRLQLVRAILESAAYRSRFSTAF